MRTKDKIEKYLDRFLKKHNGTLVESELSRYYSFRGRILRVSDHVGKTSDGNISIIFDSSDQGNYIIHGHTSGNISVLNYEQCKEFVRSFIRTSFLFRDITQVVAPKTELTSSINEQDILVKALKQSFTSKQLNQIKSFLTINRSKNYKEILHRI